MNPLEAGSQRTATDHAAVSSVGLSTLRHGWRVVRAGLAFIAFGVGGLVIGVHVLPLLRLERPGLSCAQRRKQVLFHHAFRLFACFIVPLGLIRVTWTVKERLRERPVRVVSNHPTLIDVVLLVAARRARPDGTLCFIGSGRGAVTSQTTRPEALIAAGRERLRHGRSLLLFPEGHSVPGRHSIAARRASR
jgi:1-acyl-sn-glycerol-3-phosphate acyltransferase